jgi:hypothetical protein
MSEKPGPDPKKNSASTSSARTGLLGPTGTSTHPVPGNSDKAFNPLNPARRDMTRIGQAADFLRRFGPVFRCGPGGVALQSGLHWNRGGFVLTDAELVARAERLGWDPDAWRRLG